MVSWCQRLHWDQFFRQMGNCPEEVVITIATSNIETLGLLFVHGRKQRFALTKSVKEPVKRWSTTADQERP